jgi:hypothetical protein
MDAAAYCAEIDERCRSNRRCVVESRVLVQQGRVYPYRVIRSTEIGRDDRIVKIRAGIHGEEIAGPATLLENVGRIFARLDDAGLKGIIVPLANPFGFEHGVRYSERGPRGNDDAICYVRRDDSIVDDLGTDNDFRTWFWSHRGPADRPWDASGLPAETKVWLELFERSVHEYPWQFAAFLDLHQDYFIKDRPGAYHYAFGDLAQYREIVAAIAKIVPICVYESISSGCNGAPLQTDAAGFIVRHDGSSVDAAHRLGIPHAVTVETLGATPLAVACDVNMRWINGVIDLVAR